VKYVVKSESAVFTTEEIVFMYSWGVEILSCCEIERIWLEPPIAAIYKKFKKKKGKRKTKRI
jgi:hypothetical protein